MTDAVYGFKYGDNVRISMPFNTTSGIHDVYYSIGQHVYYTADITLGQASPANVTLSVYNSNIVHNYNLDVYLNKSGTATASISSPADGNTYDFGESPNVFAGSVSDDDSGNVGIEGVQYTLQNSAGNYLIYDDSTDSFSVDTVVYAVYNDAYLNIINDANFTRRWAVPISSSYALPASTYTLTAYADDGQREAHPATSTFTIKAATTDPGNTTGGAIGVTPGTPAASQPTVSQDGSIALPAATPDAKGNSVLPITADVLKKAIDLVKADADGVKTVKLVIPKASGAKAYVPEFPTVSLASATANVKFEISTEFGTILIPANILKASDVVGAKKIGISIGSADTSGLSDDLKKKIGNKPVIDLKVIADGKELNWSNPSAPVSVSIPYTLTTEEASNSEFLTVWYIDSKGNAIPVPTAKYDAASKTITFATTHFSKYALVYNEVTFSDISNSFAKGSIEVLASKGITSGTGKDAFSPKANITRADFLVMLIKSLGLSAEFDTNFSDIKSSDYFYNAVGIAKKLGIVSGTTNGTFDPRTNISRQDMIVMAAKAMKLTGKLTSAETDLSNFTDASSISAYAKDSVAALVDMGIVSGSGKRVMPKGLATREQVAIVIYKIYNK